MKKFWPLWIGLAAAAVIAVLLLFPGTKDPHGIFEEYYSVPAFGMRGGESEEKVSAQTLFYEEKYEEAIGVYEKMIADTATDLSGREKILLAISYGETQHSTKAIDLLGQFSETNPYIYQARWYSALLYLKTGEIEKAKTVLKMLVEQSKDFGEIAGDILNQLPG